MVFTDSIKAPITFSRYSGRTELVSEVESINQSIKFILSTARGELFGDPEFGSRLHEYLFEYQGEELYQIIKDEIVRCLTQQEPRIFLTEQDITIDHYMTTVYISIRYTVRNTGYQNTYEYTVEVNEEESL